MQKLILAAAMAAGLFTGISAAQADPLTSVPQDPEARVIEVRNLCGLGWHRGPYGYCRPNYAYEPYYAPRPYPARCWWVSGPYGAHRVCTW